MIPVLEKMSFVCRYYFTAFNLICILKNDVEKNLIIIIKIHETHKYVMLSNLQCFHPNNVNGQFRLHFNTVKFLTLNLIVRKSLKIVWEFLRYPKMDLPYDSAILLLRIDTN